MLVAERMFMGFKEEDNQGRRYGLLSDGHLDVEDAHEILRIRDAMDSIQANLFITNNDIRITGKFTETKDEDYVMSLSYIRIRSSENRGRGVR